MTHQSLKDDKDKDKEHNKLKVDLIGQKHILLSSEMIQASNFEYLTNSEAVSFFVKKGADKMEVKGCQLFLQKNQGDYCVINLLDQELNNLFMYQTSAVFLGWKTFELHPENNTHYAMVVSVLLREKFIYKDTFDNDEAFMVLRNSTDRVL